MKAKATNLHCQLVSAIRQGMMAKVNMTAATSTQLCQSPKWIFSALHKGLCTSGLHKCFFSALHKGGLGGTLTKGWVSCPKVHSVGVWVCMCVYMCVYVYMYSVCVERLCNLTIPLHSSLPLPSSPSSLAPLLSSLFCALCKHCLHKSLDLLLWN